MVNLGQEVLLFFWRHQTAATGLVQEQKILIVLEAAAQSFQAGGGNRKACLGVRIIKSPPGEKSP